MSIGRVDLGSSRAPVSEASARASSFSEAYLERTAAAQRAFQQGDVETGAAMLGVLDQMVNLHAKPLTFVATSQAAQYDDTARRHAQVARMALEGQHWQQIDPLLMDRRTNPQTYAFEAKRMGMGPNAARLFEIADRDPGTDPYADTFIRTAMRASAELSQSEVRNPDQGPAPLDFVASGMNAAATYGLMNRPHDTAWIAGFDPNADIQGDRIRVAGGEAENKREMFRQVEGTVATKMVEAHVALARNNTDPATHAKLREMVDNAMGRGQMSPERMTAKATMFADVAAAFTTLAPELGDDVALALWDVVARDMEVPSALPGAMRHKTALAADYRRISENLLQATRPQPELAEELMRRSAQARAAGRDPQADALEQSARQAMEPQIGPQDLGLLVSSLQQSGLGLREGVEVGTAEIVEARQRFGSLGAPVEVVNQRISALVRDTLSGETTPVVTARLRNEALQNVMRTTAGVSDAHGDAVKYMAPLLTAAELYSNPDGTLAAQPDARVLDRMARAMVQDQLVDNHIEGRDVLSMLYTAVNPAEAWQDESPHALGQRLTMALNTGMPPREAPAGDVRAATAMAKFRIRTAARGMQTRVEGFREELDRNRQDYKGQAPVQSEITKIDQLLRSPENGPRTDRELGQIRWVLEHNISATAKSPAARAGSAGWHTTETQAPELKAPPYLLLPRQPVTEPSFDVAKVFREHTALNYSVDEVADLAFQAIATVSATRTATEAARRTTQAIAREYVEKIGQQPTPQQAYFLMTRIQDKTGIRIQDSRNALNDFLKSANVSAKRTRRAWVDALALYSAQP